MKGYVYADRMLSAEPAIHQLPSLDSPPSPSWMEIRTAPADARRKRVRRWAYRWLNEDGSASLALASNADGYLLRFPGACDFQFDPSQNTITICSDQGVDEAMIEHLLLDQVLPRVLSHLGEYAAHCSAVATEQGAAIFLGRSGWGKSTLAGLMHGRGFELLSDDCALLRPHSGRVLAVPTYRSMRLWPESLARIFPSAETTEGSSGAKRRLRFSGDQIAAPRQVDAIYVLNDPAQHRRAISIDPISPAALCLELIRHAFRLDVANRAAAKTFLESCGAIARSVPGFTLSYPRDFAETPRLIHMLSRHLEGAELPA